MHPLHQDFFTNKGYLFRVSAFSGRVMSPKNDNLYEFKDSPGDLVHAISCPDKHWTPDERSRKADGTAKWGDQRP